MYWVLLGLFFERGHTKGKEKKNGSTCKIIILLTNITGEKLSTIERNK